MVNKIKINSNPPHKYKFYVSNQGRAPEKKIHRNYYNTQNLTFLKTNKKKITLSNNLLNYKKNQSPIGQKIIVYGKVCNTRGIPLPDIFIEIWQANASGKYRDENDKHNAPLDPNFFGGGSTLTNKDGDYKFYTIIPGAYPWSNHNNAWRPKHIHFSLISSNYFSRLNTQMYFPNDVLLNDDPIFNSVEERFRGKLIASFDNKKNNITNFISYKFDIVMP